HRHSECTRASAVSWRREWRTSLVCTGRRQSPKPSLLLATAEMDCFASPDLEEIDPPIRIAGSSRTQRLGSKYLVEGVVPNGEHNTPPTLPLRYLWRSLTWLPQVWGQTAGRALPFPQATS